MMDMPWVPPAPGWERDRDRRRTVGPLYCPRCGRVAREGTGLCRDCGEALAPQGYCHVCESHWPLASGMPCPKHELLLDPVGPRTTGERNASSNEKWVTLRSFADTLRAEAPRIRLEAEGIPTVLEGERMGGPSMYQMATGGVKLQVPESMLTDARILLSQSWTPTDDTADDLDDAWDDLAPDPGATWRDLGRATVWLVLFAPLLLSLLAFWLNSR